MSHQHVDFMIQSERRRGEIAYAAQQRQLKAAQREGLVIKPLLDLQFLSVPALARGLASGLARLGSLCNRVSHLVSTRYDGSRQAVPAEQHSGAD